VYEFRVIRAILFDVDGTLIHTGGAGVKAFERTGATAFNLSKATDGLVFHGRTDTSIARELFRRFDIAASGENFARFFDTYVFWLDYLMDKVEGGTISGVWKFLRDLQNLPQPPVLGLLTGNIRLGAEIKLRHYHLWNSFEIGAFGDDHEDRNQLACVAFERVRRLVDCDLTSEEVLIVGDTPLDIACAEAIGAKMLAVATGAYYLPELQGHAPTWAVEDLRKVNVSELCS
jgi:phosphoglycolate phosphatase-like HAD superfamily hydrolase